MVINVFFSYQVLIVSRDRGKPIPDPTELICFFLQKMDSVLKMSLSIKYHTKSDPPLTSKLFDQLHTDYRIRRKTKIHTINLKRDFAKA